MFNSDQTIRVIDRRQMDIAGPVAGATQIIYDSGANACLERAVYTSYVTGGTIVKGVQTGGTSYNGAAVP